MLEAFGLDPDVLHLNHGAFAPRGGGPAHRGRRDAEGAVVEVQNVRVEAEGLQQGSVHGTDSLIRAYRT